MTQKAKPPLPPEKSEKGESPSLGTGIYRFFTSVRLAIVTLIILASTSVIGTVVLQQESAEHYMLKYGTGFYRFIRFLGLDDMYSSWWFLAILLLLLFNITLCSIDRFPRAWRLMTQSPNVLDESVFRRRKYRASIRRGPDPVEAEARATEILNARFGKVRTAGHDHSVTMSIDRGRYGRLGVFITHMSILILAVGTVYGGIMGFGGFVNIAEGQTIDRIRQRGKNSLLKLPFQIRCDNFEVVFYPGSGQPKDYFSDLTVIDSGREVLKKRIEVNHPLVYDGIFFYQTSFGIQENSTVTLQILDPSGRVASPEITMPAGRSFNVLGDPATYGIQEIITSLSGGELIVRMSRILGGSRSDFFVAEGAPEIDRTRGGPVYFRVKDADITEFTGLQVVWDPGVPVIWLACAMMMIGLFLTFFIPHRRVWVRIDHERENTAVMVAGTTSRNPGSFEREFEGLLADLKAAFKESRKKVRSR